MNHINKRKSLKFQLTMNLCLNIFLNLISLTLIQQQDHSTSKIEFHLNEL